MTLDEALVVLDAVLTSNQLSDIQALVFCHCWQGKTYAEIAEETSYDANYIKDVGAKLWKQLSQALNEKVTKNNIQSVLSRYQRSNSALRKPLIAIAEPPEKITSCYQDWGEAIDVSAFVGREAERAVLQQWLVNDRCRTVMLLGMGGIGKTSLSIKLAEQIQDQFEYLVWRSLRNAPQLENLLIDLLKFFTQSIETIPTETEGKIARLIEHLRQFRCLIVLDNMETILQSGEGELQAQAGAFRVGYEGYGDLLKRIAEARSQSCLILTSREKPKVLAPLEGDGLPVRSLKLSGLDSSIGQKVLESKGQIFGSEAQWQELVDRYAGNPLALKIVATTIRELFDGDIAEFLAQGTTVFDDIRALLQQQYDRLSELEKTVMYWLAIEREPVGVRVLHENIVPPVAKANLLEAIASLERRSLIEKQSVSYTQQPVVMEYLTQQLIDEIFAEISGEDLTQFVRFALMKAEAKDYVRESQMRVILQPVSDRLSAAFRSKQEIEQKLKKIIQTLRDRFADRSGYGCGNVINLLRYLQVDLSDFDFSNLAVWQAYLQDINLHRVNFSRSNLAKSVFAQTLGSILSVAFSADGQRLATCDADGEIRIWQVADGRQLLALRENSHWVWSLSFSPDRSLLASSHEDQVVRLWDANAGRCIREFQGHTNWVRSACFSSDGEMLVSASEDQTAKLWDVRTGECLQTLAGHAGGVCTVAFHPDGKRLVTGSADQTVRLWDLATGECLQQFEHSSRVWSIALSPDGEWLAVSGDALAVKLWNIHTNAVKSLPHTSRIWSVAISPDGSTIATGGDDQMVRLWNLDTADCLRVLYGHSNRVWSVAFSPNGEQIATGSDDQTVRLWEVSTGQCLKSLQGFNNWIWCVATSKDGQLASGSEDRTVRIWNSGRCETILKGHMGRIWSIAFSPDGQSIASGSDDQTVKLWDIQARQCRRTLRGHTRQVRSIAFSPDGEQLASCSGDQTVKLWDVQTGQCLKTLQGHTSWLASVAFAPADQSVRLASAGDDRIICLWDASGLCVNQLSGHTRSILCLAFSPTGLLASGSDDETLKLWDIQTAECLATLQGHAGRILSIAFSADGRWVASSSSDETVKLWDVQTGDCLATFEGHSKWVHSVAFLPKDRTRAHDRLVSSSEDETIRLWNLQTNQSEILRVDRPYEAMNITEVTGLTDAQRATLVKLGAVDRQICHS